MKCSCQEKNFLTEQQPKNYDEVSGSLQKSQEESGNVRKHETSSTKVSRSILKHQKLLNIVSHGSCAKLLVLDSLVYIAAAAALALASKL